MPVSATRPVSAKQVKAWRDRHDLTIRDAATLFGVSDRQWSRYENKVSPIPGWLARAITKGAP